MSLLDKWSKKKEKEQLDAVETTDTDLSTKKSVTKKTTKKKDTETQKSVRTNDNDTVAASHAYGVLVHPLVSEKATADEVLGIYTFVVTASASKGDIKRAVETVYGIMPRKVRVANYEGKRLRFGRTRGKRTDWKKAFVYLPKGKTIHIHEGV